MVFCWCRETIVKYSVAVHELAMELGRMLCRSMGFDVDLFRGWPFQFRINKYSFTPQSIGSSGVQTHTDSGFLTILQDDELVGGLEVLDERSGEFVSVDPLPNSLLVNFGDVAKVRHKLRHNGVPSEVDVSMIDAGVEQWEVLQRKASCAMQRSSSEDFDCFVRVGAQGGSNRSAFGACGR